MEGIVILILILKSINHAFHFHTSQVMKIAQFLNADETSFSKFDT